MTISELVRRNRSYRRFDGRHVLMDSDLHALVDLARLSPSGGNKQALRFVVATGVACDRIFPSLGWAGYLKDWKGPIEGERPTGYIVVLCESALAACPKEDAGIAAQSIMLGAVEKELGGCIFMNINRKQLSEALALPESLEIMMVLAIGKPVETIVLEPIGAENDVKYWRDENETHHVPKRALADILIPIAAE